MVKQNVTPIPKSIESEWDFICGELICSDCGHMIINFGYENKEKMLQSSINAANNHFCSNIKFDYNFNSPLTVREQYLIAKEKQTNAFKSPTKQTPITNPLPLPTHREQTTTQAKPISKRIDDITDRRKRLGGLITIKT